MLLRESGKQSGQTFNLQSVTGEGGESGVPHGEHLRSLADATARGAWLEMPYIITRAKAAMGDQATTDALVVASAFNGITRVADATGIPLDQNTAATTENLRAETGIAEFAYERKSERF